MIGLLNKTVTITPVTYSVGTAGHPTRSEGSTSTVPGALQTLSANESLRWQQNVADEIMALYVLAGSGITPGDKVTVDSKAFEVKSPVEDMGGRGLYEKFVVKRVL